MMELGDSPSKNIGAVRRGPKSVFFNDHAFAVMVAKYNVRVEERNMALKTEAANAVLARTCCMWHALVVCDSTNKSAPVVFSTTSAAVLDKEIKYYVFEQ